MNLIPDCLKEEIQEYARLIVRTGANVQEGQEVILNVPVEAYEFARVLTKECYKAGAKEVIPMWTDTGVQRIHLQYATLEVLGAVPAWKAASKNEYALRGCAVISITGQDPEAYKGVDPERMMASAKASDEAYKPYYDKMMSSEMPWTVAAVPTAKWVEKVYPELPEEDGVEKLWRSILDAVRVTGGNAVEKWAKHEQVLRAHCDWMNAQRFVKLHYTNSLGTDFTVGLVRGHIWEGGSEACASGARFQANLPTEEIFTMPDRRVAEGTLVAAIPLSHSGNLIENFSLTFHEGKVVEYHAESGEETLKQILESDEGSLHLGEVALVPATSPIRQTGILFYNTLFDENAACHFALGECYPTTVEGGAAMSKEELAAVGGNDSMNHVDFMVGTDDLKIVGIQEDGTEVVVFENGVFAQ